MLIGCSVKDYVKDMRLAGTYGTHTEISMFNKIFGAGITIYIVGKDHTGKKVESDWGSDDMIYLRLTTHGEDSNMNHYDLLVRNGDDRSDRVKNRILARLAWKDAEVGRLEGEVEPSYVSENFEEKEAVHGGNNCVFEAICNVFQMLSLLHVQARMFLRELATDEDVDKNARYYLSARY